jgi:hypothetical protein
VLGRKHRNEMDIITFCQNIDQMTKLAVERRMIGDNTDALAPKRFEIGTR